MWPLILCLSNHAYAANQLGRYEAAVDSCDDAFMLLARYGAALPRSDRSAQAAKLESRRSTAMQAMAAADLTEDQRAAEAVAAQEAAAEAAAQQAAEAEATADGQQARAEAEAEQARMQLQQHEAQPGGCDMQPAVQVLLQTLQHQSTDALHVKLGVVYSAAADYGAALAQFHSALSYNPDNEEAKNGVERLTKLLQGADPDADEDGDYDLEENDDDDVQGI